MPSENFCVQHPEFDSCKAMHCAANPSAPECIAPGSGGGDDGGDDGDDGDDWCTDHPDSVVCQSPSAGGGDCSAAPSCDGDPVGCAQLNMQWQLKCQAEQREDERQAMPAVNCDAVPTCSGDPIDCAALTQQHKDACLGDVKVTGDPDNCNTPPLCTGGVFECNTLRAILKLTCRGQVTWDNGDPNNQPADISGLTPAAITSDGGDLASGFDAGGFLGAGSCPEFPTVSVMGMSLDFNVDSFCTVMQLLGALVLATAYFKAARIVLGP
jgi:hypothetical protein